MYPEGQAIVKLSHILDGSVLEDYIWFLAGLFWCFCIFYLLGKYIFCHSLMFGLMFTYVLVQVLQYANINFLGFQNCAPRLMAFALGYTFNILYEQSDDGTIRRFFSNIKLQLLYIIIYLYLMGHNYRLPVEEERFSEGVTWCSGILFVIMVSILIEKVINVEKCGEFLKKMSYYTFPIYLLHMPLWYFLEVRIAPVFHPEKFVILYWLFEMGFVIIVPLCIVSLYNRIKQIMVNSNT